MSDENKKDVPDKKPAAASPAATKTVPTKKTTATKSTPTANTKPATDAKTGEAKKPAANPAVASNKKVEDAKPTTHKEGAVIPVSITNKDDLFAAYMPFVKDGALFVETNKKYNLDDEVFLLVKLMEESEKVSISGRVVWITPRGAQGAMSSGIGVQFTCENAQDVRRKIETYLAGTSNSDRRTDTM